MTAISNHVSSGESQAGDSNMPALPTSAYIPVPQSESSDKPRGDHDFEKYEEDEDSLEEHNSEEDTICGVKERSCCGFMLI